MDASRSWARSGRCHAACAPTHLCSLAADIGYSEPTIAALIGHKGQTITPRYVHSADAVLLAAADAVANETVVRMGDGVTTAEVIPLRRTAG